MGTLVRNGLAFLILNPLSAKPHKMFKHTQTIRRLMSTNFLSVFNHLVGLALKGSKIL